MIRISGSQPPSTIESRSSPNCWTCFLLLKLMYDVGCEAELLLMLIFFSCWIKHISNVDYCINRWSWTDFIVDVEKKCWSVDWLLMLVVIFIRWILHHSAYHRYAAATFLYKFDLCKFATFCRWWSRNCSFCKGESGVPRFFISYSVNIRTLS